MVDMVDNGGEWNAVEHGHLQTPRGRTHKTERTIEKART
jgi:hypothetical protein